MIPRIRARAAQYEEPKELKDKWCFEISIWTFDGENRVGEPLGPFGKYETEDECKSEMMKAVEMCVEQYEKDQGLEPSGKYLDMKNGGVLRPFKEHS